jgi:glutamine synthetase
MLRFIARRQVDRLASLGYAILTGIELEFMLLQQVHFFY